MALKRTLLLLLYFLLRWEKRQIHDNLQLYPRILFFVRVKVLTSIFISNPRLFNRKIDVPFEKISSFYVLAISKMSPRQRFRTKFNLFRNGGWSFHKFRKDPSCRSHVKTKADKLVYFLFSLKLHLFLRVPVKRYGKKS